MHLRFPTSLSWFWHTGSSSLDLHMTHAYSSLTAQFTCLLCEAIPYLACANLPFSEFQNALVISLSWQLPLFIMYCCYSLCIWPMSVPPWNLDSLGDFLKVSVYYNGKSIEISQSHF